VAEDRQKSPAQNARPKAGEADAPDPSKDKKVEFLTAHQLAEVLQVSESTIHRLRRRGRIPAVMLTDRLIRFNLRDVQKALRSIQSTKAQADGGDSASGQAEEASPQLSFGDLFSDFSQQ
jgi:excisionase family DNA binding protein